MSTYRDQVLDALVAELNNGRPIDVPEARRRRFSTMEADQLPIIDVATLREQSQRIGGAAGPITRRKLLIGVRCWASGDAPEIAADAMVLWVTKTLSQNRLGGLVNDIEETETQWAADALDIIYGVAEVQFAIDYQTKTKDQEERA